MGPYNFHDEVANRVKEVAELVPMRIGDDNSGNIEEVIAKN